MKQYLSLDEFLILAKKSKRVAVFKEIQAEKISPMHVYSLLNKSYKTEGVIFEDQHKDNDPHYSYICFDEIASFAINHDENSASPLTDLRHFQKKMAFSTRSDMAELITNAIGFITYDVVRSIENIPGRHAPDSSLPILLFNYYKLSLTFDYNNQTILLSVVVDVGNYPVVDYNHAQQKISDIIKLLADKPYEDNNLKNTKMASHVECDTSDADFMSLVVKAKEYITHGDAFQIVLSRCFKCNYSVSPLEIYQTLRKVSPAPFMFYFPTKTNVIIGASPERFVSVHNKEITVNPLAGTRKHTTEKSNYEIMHDLLSDKKELAEHMMLVDLARNDVGAVSESGTVVVRDLLHVKHYSHVSHITSTVTGKIQEKFDVFDAFAAAFPAGTLSGAPKIRAMEIIDELESSNRGLYGGAICRIDSLGNFDSCIAIRMAVLQDGVATIRTGAGIVYDSNPASEAQETVIKAQSMLNAIAVAHGE